MLLVDVVCDDDVWIQKTERERPRQTLSGDGQADMSRLSADGRNVA